MELNIYSDDFRDRDEVIMLNVSEREALSIIKSLSSQMEEKNSNVGRREFWIQYYNRVNKVNKDRIYFSISIKDHA